MNKIYLLTFLIFTSFFINAQDTQEEVDPNIERVEKIQDLINRVEENREELSKIDAQRIDNFIKKVADRRFLLSKAQKQLSDEEARNQRLEDLFESNEHPNRTDALNEIGKIKVHNLKNLEDLWVLHLNEINSSGEIKEIKANVINSDGDIEEDSLVRYGPFNMVKNRSFVKTDIANNAYSVLQKQPDRSLRRQFRSHYRSDGYAVAPLDPTPPLF